MQMTKKLVVVFIKTRKYLVGSMKNENVNLKKKEDNEKFYFLKLQYHLISKLIWRARELQSCLSWTFYKMDFLKSNEMIVKVGQKSSLLKNHQ